MPLRRFAMPFALLCCMPLAAEAQQHGVYISDNDSSSNRAFALVNGSEVMLNGAWDNEGGQVSRYAHAHPGHYIVFAEGGQLHRLDDPARISEAEQAYAPMVPLNARQHELALQQKPLADQQRALAEKQRAARGNPEEQGRIGQEQGRLGEQQGAIGEKQGEIGRQQGEIGRAFYNKVQGMLTTCLANNSCPRVSSDTARR